MTSNKPDWVANFQKPQGTEIKHIGNHWYLYERLSVYDRQRHRKHKKSGKCLGKITELGFVSNKGRTEAVLSSPSCLEYGASAFLQMLAVPMQERLKKHFGIQWRMIAAMAIVKCMERCPFKSMDFLYEASFLSISLGDLSLSASSITRFLKQLGGNRTSIREYMQEDIGDNSVILFDGHRIVSSSGKLENARTGYDSRMRFMPQVNLMYMFKSDNDEKLPLFYRQFSGDIPDVTAFEEILAESGACARNAIVIGDKGFGSEDNFSLLTESGLRYVIPLYRGWEDTQKTSINTYMSSSYSNCFTYRQRAIFCSESMHENYKVLNYYDLSLANNEIADSIERLKKRNAQVEAKREKEAERRRKGKGRMSDEELNSLVPVDVAAVLQEESQRGSFSIRTNCMDLNCEQIYHLYKERQDIEQSFKFFDEELDSAGSYMQSQTSLEAWLFINHLALQLLYMCLQRMLEAGINSKYSFCDLMRHLKSIMAIKSSTGWVISKITKKTMELCHSLGIELATPTESMAP